MPGTVPLNKHATLTLLERKMPNGTVGLYGRKTEILSLCDPNR